MLIHQTGNAAVGAQRALRAVAGPAKVVREMDAGLNKNKHQTQAAIESHPIWAASRRAFVWL